MSEPSGRARPGLRFVTTVVLAAIAWLAVRLATSHPAAALPVRAVGWPDMRIDVNAASVAELTVLPGLGPSLAERIVDHRDRHGPFASLDALAAVDRIGPLTVDGLREHAIAAGSGGGSGGGAAGGSAGSSAGGSPVGSSGRPPVESKAP